MTLYDRNISADGILKKIRAVAAVRTAEGPLFKRESRANSGLLQRNLVPPSKPETKIYRFAKKVQQKIRKYPFYNFAYNAAYKFKRFIPKHDESLKIEELLNYRAEEFLHHAYRRLLLREPDAQGNQTYFQLLKNGELSKTDIILRLRFSAEGKKKHIKVKGLYPLLVIHFAYRIPIIGYLLHLFSTLIRLPQLRKQVQRLETYIAGQSEHYDEITNRIRLDNLERIKRLEVDLEIIKKQLLK